MRIEDLLAPTQPDPDISTPSTDKRSPLPHQYPILPPLGIPGPGARLRTIKSPPTAPTREYSTYHHHHSNSSSSYTPPPPPPLTLASHRPPQCMQHYAACTMSEVDSSALPGTTNLFNVLGAKIEKPSTHKLHPVVSHQSAQARWLIEKERSRQRQRQKLRLRQRQHV